MSNHAETALQFKIKERAKERLGYIEEFLEGPIPEGPKLNLACGALKFRGWVNVDINEKVNPDICMDLDDSGGKWVIGRYERVCENFTEKYKDHFEFCMISHYLEHVRDLVSFMKNLYAVMKPGSLVWISCPYAWSDAAIEDPTHVRFINENSMMYFNRTLYQKHPSNGYNFEVDFETVSIKLAATRDHKRLYEHEIDKIKREHINIINEVQFLLRVIKPMREVKEG